VTVCDHYVDFVTVAMMEIFSERDPRTYAIIGAAMEVHKRLGYGFLEPVYQEALAIEFSGRNIPFTKEVRLPIHYKGHQLETKYRADFLCFDAIVVELKALARMGGVEDSQLINYLKATSFQLGLLLNFGARSLQYRRLVFSQSVESA
jgi:GxxExxY protein